MICGYLSGVIFILIFMPPFLILSFWTFDTIAVTRYTYDMAMMDQAVKDRCSGQLAGE